MRIAILSDEPNRAQILESINEFYYGLIGKNIFKNGFVVPYKKVLGNRNFIIGDFFDGIALRNYNRVVSVASKAYLFYSTLQDDYTGYTYSDLHSGNVIKAKDRHEKFRDGFRIIDYPLSDVSIVKWEKLDILNFLCKCTQDMQGIVRGLINALIDLDVRKSIFAIVFTALIFDRMKEPSAQLSFDLL